MELSVTKIIYMFLINTWQEMDVARWGPCPAINVKSDLERSKFMGKWYEYQVYTMPRINEVCVEHYFDSDRYTVKAIDMSVRKTVFWNGTFALPNDNIGWLEISMPDSFFGIPKVYQILETDYENYAILYSCDNLVLGVGNSKRVYVLSRNPSLPKYHRSTVNTLIDINKLNHTRLVYTDQSNCTLAID